MINSNLPKMEITHPTETESQIVLSYGDLWDWIIGFVYYMDSHNQTSNVENVIDSIVANNETVYRKILHSMLGYMAKYGFPNEFPDDVNIFLKDTPSIKCNRTILSKDEESLTEGTSFWLEGICLTTVAVFGIIGNIFAAKIFCARGNKFNTLFYRILICLLFTQTCYIGFSVCNFWGLFAKNNFSFNKMFSNGLYPLPSMMLHTSTILTVLLAW